MKKQVLLVVLILGFFSISNANEKSEKNITVNEKSTRYGYMEPFKFIERGIEFYVFPNGEFDFNTHPQYRRTRRGHSSVNISYGVPRSYNNRGISIEHDHLGRVRRIGNVFVNYDAFDRIKRVGSVYMNYNRNLIRNIGGLHVFYDRHHRIIRTTGHIKRNLRSRNCHTNHYNNSGHGHHNHQNNWNNDHLYYKKGKSKNRKR